MDAFFPSMADNSNCDEFELEPGDIIVVATDGIIDNLSLKEIIECVNADLPLKERAYNMAKKAYDNSNNKDKPSPFEHSILEAIQSGQLKGRRMYKYKTHKGGKPDDTTVIIAEIR